MTKLSLQGRLVYTHGEVPALGSIAPDFILVDQKMQDRSLADYAGKKKVLNIAVSFDTGICLNSAKAFFEKLNDREDVVVLNISADLPFALGRLIGTEKLKSHNVIFLSMMRNKDFARDYGVLLTDGALAGLSCRCVLLLDENNQVVYQELVAEISHEPNYQALIDALNEV